MMTSPRAVEDCPIISDISIMHEPNGNMSINVTYTETIDQTIDDEDCTNSEAMFFNIIFHFHDNIEDIEVEDVELLEIKMGEDTLTAWPRAYRNIDGPRGLLEWFVY